MPAVPTVDIDPGELRRFEEALGKLVSKSGISASVVVRKVFLDLLRDIMRGTPVDTGRARAAWSVVFDLLGGRAPSIGATSGVAQGKREGELSTNLPSSVSSDLRASTKADAPFAEITNNVKYILPLEFGRSKQAPQGMVRRTIRRHAREFLKQLQESV